MVTITIEGLGGFILGWAFAFELFVAFIGFLDDELFNDVKQYLMFVLVTCMGVTAYFICSGVAGQ